MVKLAHNLITSCARIILLCTCLLPVRSIRAQDLLERTFINPPDDAKPRGYWLWAHGNFDYATMKKELKAFSEMGLGGVDIFDMGIADPYEIIPPGNRFMGDEMLDGIAFALREAAGHGLQMGLSVSNGWNAGGDWTRAEEKLMRLLFWQDTLEGPTAVERVGFPEVPVRFEKPYGSYELFPTFTENGFPEFYEDVALVAYPLSNDRRIGAIEDILYFDANAIDGHAVDLKLPEGQWVLVRAVVTPLGQKMWMASDRSNGYIMDHYSKNATRHHFEYIISKLESRMGNLENSALERLYLASFEAEDYVIWSPALRARFYAQHGYEIDPYIPVLAGLQVVDEEITQRFLYDYRSTVSEMFINNHYRQASAICREHGLLLASESGGPGPPLHYVPTEDLKALGSVDIMRGEFWNAHERWKTEENWRDKYGNNLLQVVKNVGSAAHIYGHKIVEMEAFTSHSRHWQETPFDLKLLADRAFCEGMTRVVYHTMPHSPPEAGVPGWSYQAGTHIHPKMTWWPMSAPFHKYLARCGAMLMQGHFVADVAYFYGSGVPNFATTKFTRPDLGPGYDYDDLNTEVLLQISQVHDGRIVLPSGMEYAILVLPKDRRMKPEVLLKIEELLQKGATVIGPRPTRVYGLKDYKEKEQKLNELADRIWGTFQTKKIIDRHYGRGRIVFGRTAREILAEKGIGPDLQYAGQSERPVLDYIHRKTNGADIYFMRNMDSTNVHIEPVLRVHDMQPERWDPLTGEMHVLAVFAGEPDGTRISLDLPAYGSALIIFRRPVEKPHVVKVTRDERVIFPTFDRTSHGCGLHYDQMGNLIMSTSMPGHFLVTTDDGREYSAEVAEPQTTHIVDSAWDVRFPDGWGATPIQDFDSLIDWTSSGDPGLKYFSGLATYRKTFSLPEPSPGQMTTYILDLGRVGAVARVYLNGREVATSLFPPHRVVVTDMVQDGDNHLVVEVANTWLNRLIGDLRLPPEQRYTRSNVGTKGDPANRPWSTSALQPSGLIGPVQLIVQKKTRIAP